MYKSELQAEHVLGSYAEVIIDGHKKAIIYEVKASGVTNGLPGLLVCVRAPKGEYLSETFSFERGADDAFIMYYDLGEFIPMGEL